MILGPELLADVLTNRILYLIVVTYIAKCVIT